MDGPLVMGSRGQVETVDGVYITSHFHLGHSSLMRNNQAVTKIDHHIMRNYSFGIGQNYRKSWGADGQLL